jgi:hypothetical protein
MEKGSLSVCLVITGDRKYLPSALENVKDIASEVIIINSPPGPLSNNGLWPEQALREGGNEVLSSPLSRRTGRDQSLRQEFLPRHSSLVTRHSFPWNDDISAVKNYALTKATGEWILFYETGYFLSKESKIKLRQYLEEDITILYLNIFENEIAWEDIHKQNREELKNQIAKKHGFPVYPEFEIKIPENQVTGYRYFKPCLFRNGKGIEYQGRVYENIRDLEKYPAKITDINVKFCFFGVEQKQIQVEIQKKLLEIAINSDKPEKNKRLFYQANLLSLETWQYKKLKLKLEKTTFNLFLFSDQILKKQLENEIFRHSKKFIEEIPLLLKEIETEKDQTKFSAFYQIAAEIISELEGLEAGRKIVEMALEKYPLSLQFWYLRGTIFLKAGHLTGAINSFLKLLIINENPVFAPEPLYLEEKTDVRLFEPDQIYNLLAKIYIEMNDWQSLEFYFNKIINKSQFPDITYFYYRKIKKLPYLLQMSQTDVREAVLNETKNFLSEQILEINNDLNIVPSLSEKELIILNNIVKPLEEPLCDVNPLWKKLIGEYPTKEFIEFENQGWNGTGIAFLKFKKKECFNRFNLVSLSPLPVRNLLETIYFDIVELLKYSFAELEIEYTTSKGELKKGWNNLIFSTYSTPQISNYVMDYSFIPFQMEQLALINSNEHLDSSRYRSHFRLLKSAMEIWDYSSENIIYLNSAGISNINHVPFGFHEKMDIINHNKSKPIDILFYGELNLKRTILLNKLKEKGFRVVALKFVYGKERNRYIENSKIILNISRFSQTLLEEHRLSFLLNNRCFVISEKPQSPVPDYYKGIVFCPADKLVETCEYYLNKENDNLRDTIAEKSYQIFSGHKMTDNLKKILPLSKF